MPWPAEVQRSRPLLYVQLVFHPDTAASSILFTDLFRAMARGGASISVLCGFPSKDVDLDLSAIPRRERLDGVDIRRVGLRLVGKRSLPLRLLTYLSFLGAVSWTLLREGRRATVLVGTDPPIAPLAVWVLSRLGRFPYSLNLLDIYPEGLIQLGRLRASSLPARIWRRLNRSAYRSARQVLVLGRDSARLLETVYGLPPERVTVIPHWAPAEIDALEDTTGQGFLPRLGLATKFVVQYSGNMGLWHDLDTIVRAAALLADAPQVHFLLIGKGMRRAPAEALARELGEANITWMDFLPREDLAESLLSCHASIVSLREGLEGVAVPSKFYGILASGRPVLAQVPVKSEVALTVEESGCGVVVPPGDPSALADVIRRLATNPDLTEEMGRTARDVYRSHYSIAVAAQRYGLLGICVWEGQNA